VKAVGKLVVVSSPALRTGEEHSIDSGPLLVGREGENDVPLLRDEFSSGRHARFEPRRDGVYIEDIGSTNGTFVNGVRLTSPKKLSPGDVIRIGETDLRFER
jgi:pSer/pThr/pTyr-binding forkhead associated (FHA) protein